MNKRWDRTAIDARCAGAHSARGAILLMAIGLLSGCGALHPIKGVPASYLPAEYLGPSRDGLRPINPMLLTRSKPGEYLVDAGDVLTIYVPGVLGTASTDVHTIGETPPINFPQDQEMPPTIGFPITVRDDGRISLPQVPPIPVRGLTLAQVEEAVRMAYTTPKQILAVGKERILVSLQRSRQYRILVVREDSSFVSATGGGIGTVNLGNTRRGTARIVSLKAYENDVLHALARSQGADGLPGLDAEGAIYVIRRRGEGGSGFPPCGVNGFGPAFPAGPGWQANARSATGTIATTSHDTVVRFQSPEGDYRSGRGSTYGGHSFAAPPPVLSAGGRYGQPAAGWNNAPAPQMSGAPLAMGSGRYGTAGPTGSFAAPPNGAPAGAIAPSNWNAVANQSSMNPLSSNRYGAGSPLPVRSVSMPTAMPMQTAPGNGAFIPAGPMPAGIGMPAAGAPLGRPLDPSLMGQPAYPSYPLSAPQIPVQPGHTGMPPGAGPMPSASIGWAPVNLPPMATEDYFDTMLTAGLDGTIDGPNVVRIPVRIGPGETPQIREGDITLEDGDIVFIEARSSEVFYTGGLLGGGQFTLPRDYDLRALEALSIAQAGGSRGGVSKSVGGVSALNQDVTISASKLIVVRKLVDGTSVPIEVDLNHAKQDMTGRENIIIQPGDYLYLQYSCLEAVGAFFERHLLEGALFGLATAQFQSNGN